MVCKFCRREIRDGERQYFSRQAGMQGRYHWECFVAACRQANRTGALELEAVTVSENRHWAQEGVEIASE